MALIKSVRGFTPKMGENCYLADNATLIGDVEMGDDCSIWFGAVLRGDVNSIRIGNRVNVQDNSTIHTTFEESVAEIGDDVTIGHNVVIHGARIEAHALIGIGSVLLDNCVVGSNTIVAAGSVVLEKSVLEANSSMPNPTDPLCRRSGWYSCQTHYTQIWMKLGPCRSPEAGVDDQTHCKGLRDVCRDGIKSDLRPDVPLL